MGWWGKGILEGDSPSDMQYMLERRLLGEQGARQLSDAESIKVARKFWKKLKDALNNTTDNEKKIIVAHLVVAHLVDTEDMPSDGDKAIAAARKVESYDCTVDIAASVFAFLSLAWGVTLSPAIRLWLVDTIKRQTFWGRDKERKQHIKKLTDAIKTYNNEPTVAEDQAGLFDALADALVKADEKATNASRKGKKPTIKLLNKLPSE